MESYMGNEIDNVSLHKETDDRICFIRGQWVIIDRDLADLYGVSTKVLNQQVKRNIERFPTSFMFELNRKEFNELVTICDRFKKLKHSSAMPHAFTEQGVSMLSAVLRSPTAIQVSIRIIESFVRLRRMLTINASVFQRLDKIEQKQFETDNSISEIFSILSNKAIPSQGIFYDGQIYDAYTFVADLVRKAEKRIILIDNYIDDTVLTLLDKRKDGVAATVHTSRMTKELELDIHKHNAQYRPIEINVFKRSHDRFMIIDSEVYLIGASIKDLGKKWFGFTLMESITPEEILDRI